MKKILFITFALALGFFTSCTKDYEYIEEYGEKNISLVFDGDFQFESFTRASDTDLAKDIWIFDYMDSKLIQVVHQSCNDDNFGNPQITLKYGKHDMYILMSSGTAPNLMQYYNTITWEVVGDTFWVNATAEIKESSSSELRVSLRRVVSMLRIKSLESIPENVKYIRIIPSIWHYGINYLTGKPETYSENREVLYELNRDSNTEISLYGFFDKDETTNIEISSLSETKSVIKSSTASNIPFKANKITTISTRLFNDGDSGCYNYSFIVNSNWDTGYNIML